MNLWEVGWRPHSPHFINLEFRLVVLFNNALKKKRASWKLAPALLIKHFKKWNKQFRTYKARVPFWIALTLQYRLYFPNIPSIPAKLKRVRPSPISLAKSVIKNWSWLCWSNLLAHLVKTCKRIQTKNNDIKNLVPKGYGLLLWSRWPSLPGPFILHAQPVSEVGGRFKEAWSCCRGINTNLNFICKTFHLLFIHSLPV